MTPGVIEFKLLQMETMLSFCLIQVRAVQVQNSFELYAKLQTPSKKDQSLKVAPSLYFSESVQTSE